MSSPRIDDEFLSDYVPWVKPIAKRKMTILAGVINSRSIVFASDTQETSDDDLKNKSLDSAKLGIIRFANKMAIVGVSGDIDLTVNFLEKFERDAAKVTVPDSDSHKVSEVAQDAMRAIRRDRGCAIGLSGTEFAEYVLTKQPRCSIMVGYFCAANPLVYQIHFNTATATKINRQYIALGSGSSIGSYLLRDNVRPDMTRNDGMVVAIHAVDVAKENADGCGGQTKVALLEYVPDWYHAGTGEAKASMLPDERVLELSALIAKVEAQTKKSRHEKLNRLLSKDMVKRLADALLSKSTNET